MDNLERRLREDAGRINVEVSPQLDERIRASLEGVTQQGAAPVPPKAPRSMWWASSLTGIAAAAAVILIINLGTPTPPEIEEVAGVPGGFPVDPPIIPELNPQRAVFPLEQELENLESDLKKAEQALRDELPPMF